jgi:non-heme chloroperoxidase
VPTVTTSDGTTIYYKDWGAGQPVVFSHGWPLNADAWEAQMVFMASHGYRSVGHDRRGHGRSSQPWDGNEMDTYADDLATVIEALDLRRIVLVGHSTGGGEVTRYVGRHGTSRVAKVVLVGAVPPLMLKTEANPGGLPIEAFDGIRAGTAADRSQFFKDLTTPFFGANRPGSTVSQGLRDAFWFQGMAGGLKNELDCIKAFSETDFTEDLKKIDVPTLIIHGDDDRIVPIGASAYESAKLMKDSILKVYPGGAHSLADTSRDQLNADLLEFIKGSASNPGRRVRRTTEGSSVAPHRRASSLAHPVPRGGQTDYSRAAGGLPQSSDDAPLRRPTRSRLGVPEYSVACRQLKTSYSPFGSLTSWTCRPDSSTRTISPGVYQMPTSGTWCVENLPVLLM